MRSLQWNENDFLNCLEVSPHVEDELEYHYSVERGELALSVIVIPYRRFVTFSLFHRSTSVPITSFSLLVAGSVSCEKDKRGEYLRFSSCRFVADPDFYEDELHQDTETYKSSFHLGVELFVKPHIRIKFS